MPQLPERFRVNSEEVAAKVVEGEAIVINLTSGVYYSMDGLGARIWSLLEAHHGVDAIADAIADGYAVPRERCRSDVETLIRQLLEENLILETEESPSGRDALAGVASGKLDYAAPELNIYRDMGDLLALDPPVPGLEPIPWDDPTQPAK
ncbi:MAG: PqqD family protein [Gemmatimonadetes bacterium]|nr:PqqD family protein [Gemmatimonadota bacterium]